jgi:two-component system response regulator GlrR
MDPSHILIVDLASSSCPENHCGRFAKLLRSMLSTRAIDVQTVTHCPPKALAPPDLIFLRPSMTENLSKIVWSLKSEWKPAPILGLFCTGRHTPAAVYQALHHDVDDFLSCPFRDIDVFPRVQRLLLGEKESPTAPQAEELRVQCQITGLIGESGPFLQVIQRVLGIAHSDATVLLAGETGTGKELVARAIHYRSPRQGKPFVPVNCGALPDHLVENELFGHAKGAYTDASTSEEGFVAEAKGGTLFLDEVDTLTPSAQVKLLRFLQDHEYRPLGCSKSKTADVRIIAATNADLMQQVQIKRFREDLYYRLNVFFLHLPPLRERAEDIPLLAVHFLRRYGNQYGCELLRFPADTLTKLAAYPWPGNVRELETVIHRAVILASSPVIQPDDIELPHPYQGDVPQMGSFRTAKTQMVEQFERVYLTNLLVAHDGNITRAAKQAGKDRRALQRLLQKYNLNRGTFQV